MSPLSLMTKLQTVFDLITSKNLYLMILAAIVILTIIFITTNGSNRKQSKRTYINFRSNTRKKDCRDSSEN